MLWCLWCQWNLIESALSPTSRHNLRQRNCSSFHNAKKKNEIRFETIYYEFLSTFEYFKSTFYGFLLFSLFDLMLKKKEKKEKEINFLSQIKFFWNTFRFIRLLFFLRIRIVNKYSLENDQYFSKSFLFDEWPEHIVWLFIDQRESIFHR